MLLLRSLHTLWGWPWARFSFSGGDAGCGVRTCFRLVTADFAQQNFLRCQNNKTNYNLVCETLQFLDIMCGSTTGGLGLLGLYINEYNVALITQTLETLTEYCQGPCHENQVCGVAVPVPEAFHHPSACPRGHFGGMHGQQQG